MPCRAFRLSGAPSGILVPSGVRGGRFLGHVSRPFGILTLNLTFDVLSNIIAYTSADCNQIWLTGD